MADKDRICLGVITGARGLRGEVRVKSFAADPKDLTSYGPLTDAAGKRTFRLEPIGLAKGVLICRIDGVADRAAAEELKGVKLFVPRTALPRTEEDEHYFADLIGLRVEFAQGGDLGTVQAVHDFGAGAVLDISLPGKSSVLIPFTRTMVPKVDIAAGKLIADPPPGLLDLQNSKDQKGER